jgi:L-lysine exporter family protein LysE/ArgO
MKIFLEGFLLQGSLILALGAQNLFVLESGLRKQRHLLAATMCSLCDLILIAVGVMGAASIFVQIPLLKIIFGAVGVAFLVYYGVKKIIEGLQPSRAEKTHAATAKSVRRVVMLSLGFSLLNPHVYLDTVVLIGGYSSKFSEIAKRIEFGAGAASFSMLWFFGLATFAASMRAFLGNPKAMQIISLLSGIILLVLAWKLGRDVHSWTTLNPHFTAAGD